MTYLAIDTETTGIDSRVPLATFDDPSQLFPTASRPFIVSCCDDKGRTRVYQWPVDPITRKVVPPPQDLADLCYLFLKHPVLVFHNALFDVDMLASIGLDLTNRWGDIHDTLASSHVLDSGEPHGLKALASKYLGIPNDDEEELKYQVKVCREHARRQGCPRGPSVETDYFMPKLFFNSDVAIRYAERDAVRTSLLFNLHAKELGRQNLVDHYERERAILPITHAMRTAGLRMRPRVLSRELARYTLKRDASFTVLKHIASQYGNSDINCNSHPQLSTLLFERMQLPSINDTPKGLPSTDAESLNQLAIICEDITARKSIHRAWESYGLPRGRINPWQRDHYRLCHAFLSELLAFRSSSTAVSYLTGYQQHAVGNPANEIRIHTHLNPWGTRTTRYASSRPNLQNVGKQSEVQLRCCFGPAKDMVWYSFDYNQLELRLMAVASGDPTLTRILREGGDRHQITADALDVPRKQAKNINFAWQYGAGLDKLSRMAGTDADSFHHSMTTAYPGVVRFMESTIAGVMERVRQGHGYVETLYGYRLTVPASEAYKGINFIIQGTAGDILKLALIELDHFLRGTQARLILCVHDEILIECPVSYPLHRLRRIVRIMEAQGRPIECPLPVNVSRIRTGWDRPQPVRFTLES